MTLVKNGVVATGANENLLRNISSPATDSLISAAGTGVKSVIAANPNAENMSSRTQNNSIYAVGGKNWNLSLPDKESKGNITISNVDTPKTGNSDSLPGILQIKNMTTGTLTFDKNRTNLNSTINSSYQANIGTISYTPKFVCGTISSNNGPLRPGYYDTDISIFNKQNYPIKLLWNVVVSDGPSSNAIIKHLSAETSTKISCSDLQVLISNNTNFLEGFIVIVLPISGNILGAFPDPSGNGVSILRPVDDTNADLIDVQVFYTANALPNLPQNMITENVAFQIIADPSNKIPKTSLNRELEISFVSDPNKVYDPENRTKMFLAKEHGMSGIEVNNLKIKINRTDVVTSYQQDDHAISSSRINPDIRYTN
ncbi:MAG TPA: hypothetical protein VFI64_00410 [Nitrososphaeraceae archaeon]|nr:hypothetical protein [Nitrososphaeraceae archaeon]